MKFPISQDMILWLTAEYFRGAVTVIEKSTAITKSAELLALIPDEFMREQYVNEIAKCHKDIVKRITMLRALVNKKVEEPKEKKKDEEFKKEVDGESELGEKDQINTSRALKRWMLAEKFLTKNYDMRNNTIKNTIELRKKAPPSECSLPSLKELENSWTEFDENEMLRIFVYNKIPLSMSRMISLVKSDFVSKFNPFKEYFQSVAVQFPSFLHNKPFGLNNGTDHDQEDFIGKIGSYVHCIDQETAWQHSAKTCI